MLKSKLHVLVATIFILIVGARAAAAQTSALQLANVVNTIAGTGTAALYGDGGQATAADLNQPHGVATDAARNAYIADTGNNVIRRIDAITGVITTVAGTGTAGFSGDAGIASQAQLNAPAGVAVDSNGDVFIADTGNSRVRVVYFGGAAAGLLIALENPAVKTPVVGYIYTVAGGAKAGFGGDQGLASSAALLTPQHVAVDLSGNVYVSDTGNNRVRAIFAAGSALSGLIKAAAPSVSAPVAGDMYTVTGTGAASSTGDGAAAGLASVNAPAGVAVDPLGNLFVSEAAGNRVRVIFAGGTLMTALIQLDAAGAPVPVVNAIYTLIGTGTAAYTGDGGLGSAAAINQPGGLFVDSAEDICLADSGNRVVRLLTAATGVLRTFAGNNGLGAGFSGDQGLATAAQFAAPGDVTQDAAGRLLIADGGGNQRLRVVSTNTVLPTTLVGSTSASQTLLLQINSAMQLASLAPVASVGGASAEFSAALSSNCTLGSTLAAGTLCKVTVNFTPAFPGQRNVPLVATDSTGKPYSFALSGIGSGAQTSILPGQMTTIAGTGVFGYSGDNGPAATAVLDIPGDLAVDAAGNLFFMDRLNYGIRVIYKSGAIVARLIALETGHTAVQGNIYTIAGSGANGSGLAASGVLATTVKLTYPTNLTIDANDNVYFVEDGIAVRMLSAQTGFLSVVAGTTAGYNGDNIPATTAKIFLPNGLAVDNMGNLYISDEGNYRIRKIVLGTGIITTVAGTGTGGNVGDGGPAISAQIDATLSVVADVYGNVFLADDGSNQTIRVIYGGGSPAVNPVAHLITLAYPSVTTPVQGYLYSIAGNGTADYTGDGGPGYYASIDFPYSLALDAADNIYFAEFGSNHVRRVDIGNGVIRTIGGNTSTLTGSAGGDGGVATSASLNKPYGVAIDGAGNIYVGDGTNNRIRFISSAAYPVTFASTAVGTTTASQLVTAESDGNLPYDFAGLALNGPFATVNSGTTFVPQCGLATPLAAGLSCTSAITFAPHSDGAITGTEVFAGSAPTQTVQLIGTGTGGTATTATLSLPATAVYGSSVQVTATVVAGSTPVSGGTVVFSNGAQTIATVSLNSTGTASTTLPLYGVGTANIALTYSAVGTANLASSTSASINITPATLTVTANSQSLVYGQPLPALTYSIAGFVNNDSAAVISGAPVLSTTATSSSSDGAYPITCATGTLSAANYTFVCVNGSLTVSGATAQSIAFSALPNVVYGAAPFALTATSSSGLPVTLAVTSGPAKLSGNVLTITGAGQVTVTASQGGNSVYRAATNVSQSFTVAAAPLTVVVANASRLYGASNPAFAGTVTGLVNGDTLGGTVIVSYTSAALASSPVGTYSITATLSGAAGANYSATVTPGTLTVQQAPLTVTVANGMRSYGSANPAFSATLSGLVNGDTAGINILTTFATTATTASPVGTYPITVTVSGTSAAQYAVQTVAGVLTVAPATLSLTANSMTRLYGTPNPAFTGTISGALGSDTFVETFTTPATTTTNSGRYAIVPSATGSNLANYTIAATNGTLLIELVNSQLTLTSSTASSVPGAAVSLTAAAVSTTTGTPTGSVSFYDGGTLLASSVALVNGLATYTTSSLLAGPHSFTASYAGDYNFYGSTAGAVSVAVVAAGYSVTPSAKSLTIGDGASGTVSLQLVGVGGYAATVGFACAGLPSGMSCSFAPASVAISPASASQQTMLTIGTSSAQAGLLPGEAPGRMRAVTYVALMPCVLAMLWGGSRRRRIRGRVQRLTLAVVALLGISASLTGCASPATSPTLTTKGSYTINVQTEVSAGSSQSFPLTVTVD